MPLFCLRPFLRTYLQPRSSIHRPLLRTMAALARKLPPWHAPPTPPSDVALPPLKIYNSLTRSKDAFVPLDPSGKEITWYSCGPTVYDDAHLGHARNYVSIDILRRILRDYFKFKINFVMNITDVDDKIILRGRQQHLLAEFMSKHPKVDSEATRVALKAYKAYLKKNLPLLDPELSPEEIESAIRSKYGVVLDGGVLEGNVKPGDAEAKVKMHVKTISSAANAISNSPSEGFYPATQDVLLPYLDSLYGSSIDASDHSIFTKLTRKYEERFFRDVRDLNVLDPDTLTRVTEYGEYIAEFVDKIVKNKFAYQTSDGSIYFDIQAFEKDSNHYAKLEPWNRNDKSLQADGEGALSQKTTEKRSDADFALWKASKPGEPAWPSVWGNGRPGWHIECSAMASDTLGDRFDLHSGGIDLAFPHHDNEIAQSEAYWNEPGAEKKQWVNYFLHMGHLSIQGSKMSKSLKNFTTIREALERGDWTPRSLRIVFLLGGWKDGIEITDDLVKGGSVWEDKVNNFFIKVKDPSERSGAGKSETERLLSALKEAQDAVFEALCDSFNTPAAMSAISELITKYNTLDNGRISSTDAEPIARWITSLVNTFGLNGTATPESPEIGWAGIDIPDEARPYLYPLSSIRDSLRSAARSKESLTPDAVKEIIASKSPAAKSDITPNQYSTVLSAFKSSISSLPDSPSLPKEILSLCDRVRDVDLWDIGIYLEDRENQPALIRPVSKSLIEAREERAERARQKQGQKQAEKEARDAEAKAKADKGRLSHMEMFKTEVFSAWDEDGVPTKDKEGVEIAKSRAKKLRKDWERQKKAHEAWKAVNGE